AAPLLAMSAEYPASPAAVQASGSGATSTPIQHVVVIMMENHTYDNLFGQFVGGNGVFLPPASNPMPVDVDHSGPATYAAMDGGRMDEFPVLGQVQYSRADIPIYWNYAAQYGLGDAFFSSAATAS